MVLGKESVVSCYAPRRDLCGCASIVVGHYMSAYYLGNGTPSRSRRYGIWWFIHISLARNAFILSGTGMDFCGLLHIIWVASCGKLVLGAPSSIRKNWESKCHLTNYSSTLHQTHKKCAPLSKRYDVLLSMRS